MEGYLHIPSGVTATIDLNGHTLCRNLTAVFSTGYIILNEGTLTISDSGTSGTITGGKSTTGGAIYNTGTLTINGGSITGNYADGDGGAIYTSGELTVNGGNFSSNTAKSSAGAIRIGGGTANITGGTAEKGGAVFVKKDKSFNACGTAFIGNKATNGSGGAVYSYGNVDMNNCLISGNTASDRGGALYNGDDATAANLTDTVIKNNTANYGGGVFINTGAVNLTGCTVIGNQSNNSGGGVFTASSASPSLTAESTLFKGNSAGTNGGAVNALSDIRLTDCTVTGNTARHSGRGVCLYGTMGVAGKNIISGNGSDNVYLATNDDNGDQGMISRYDTLSDQTHIGVKSEDYDRVLVSGLTQQSEGDYFVLDDTNTNDYELTKSCFKNPFSSTYYVYVKKTVKVSVNSWQGLQDAIDDGDYEKIITLSGNITASSSQTRTRIYDGDTITIDLNGKTLSRARSSSHKDGHVIEIHGGKLTVRDSSSDKTGKITGGWASNGGGINCHGKMTLTNCKINGNKADGKGAGIYQDADGTCTITGDDTQINDNKSKGSGAGVYLEDNKLEITGGTVSGNNANEGHGGGFYLNEGGSETFVARNVTISNNKGGASKSHSGDHCGGAIYMEDDGETHLKNVSIIGNTRTDNAVYADEDFYISGKIVIQDNDGKDDLYLDNEKPVVLESKLDKDSRIGIALGSETGTFTKNFNKYHENEEPKDYFFPNEEGYSVQKTDKGEGKVVSTDWINLQRAINAAITDDYIILTKNYTADDSDKTLTIPSGKTITLDLNGFTLDGSGEIGAIIRVSSGAVLTITDSVTNADKQGTITGGSASAIENYGEMTLEADKIKGNSADNYGGGIDNRGTLTITGGEISSNTSTNGGGVYNAGTMDFYGGKIKDNTAVSGGGISCNSNSKLYVKCAPYVRENTASSGKNILLSKGVAVTLNGTLNGAAKLDVATKDYKNAITSGYAAKGRPQGVFIYNENNRVSTSRKKQTASCTSRIRSVPTYGSAAGRSSGAPLTTARIRIRPSA